MTTVVPTMAVVTNVQVASAHQAVKTMLQGLPLTYATLLPGDVMARLKEVTVTANLEARLFPWPFSELFATAGDSKRSEAFLVEGLRRTLTDTLTAFERLAKAEFGTVEILATT